MYLLLLFIILLVILLAYVLHAKKSETLKPIIYKEETIIEEIVHPEIPKPSPILKNKWLHVSDEFGVMQPGISEPYYRAKKKKQEDL
jgi:hypothetical protein